MVYIPPWGWLPFDMTLGWNSWNTLSVVNSARVWRIDSMPMLNVTKSDWAGFGRAQKDMILSGSLAIVYDDKLSIKNVEGYLYLLVEWPFLNILAAIIGISIITWLFIRYIVFKT